MSRRAIWYGFLLTLASKRSKEFHPNSPPSAFPAQRWTLVLQPALPSPLPQFCAGWAVIPPGRGSVQFGHICEPAVNPICRQSAGVVSVPTKTTIHLLCASFANTIGDMKFEPAMPAVAKAPSNCTLLTAMSAGVIPDPGLANSALIAICTASTSATVCARAATGVISTANPKRSWEPSQCVYLS